MMTENTKTGWAAALPFYYGWIVLAASAISEMLAIGATSYSAGLFVLPLQAELGLSRAHANLAVPLIFLGSLIIIPFAGRTLDRYSIRLSMCVGTFSLCLAMVIIALTSSLTMMILALLLPAAAGFSLLGPLTTSTLVSRWFFRHRGLALGIAAIATSGGGFTVVPLMSVAIRLYGWRTALLDEAGIFMLVILALTFIVLKDNPAQLGLSQHPENSNRVEPNPFSETLSGSKAIQGLRRWKEVLGNRGFWAPSLMVAMVSGLCQGIVVSAVPYGIQLGFTLTIAAFLISAFSITAAITKILAGIVSDVLDKRFVLLFAGLCMMASLAILCLASNYWGLLIACCLAGMALGGALPTSAALIAARFGSTRFGATMAWAYVLIGAFTIMASWIAGAVFDRTGQYHYAFAIFLAFCMLISFIALMLERKRAD